MLPTFHAMEPVALRWPVEEERRRQLADAGVPRLLVIEPGALPPAVESPLEDWIRTPASEIDRAARIEVLRRRANGADTRSAPTVDENGIVRTGRQWAAVPPVEARLVTLLIERFGAVVSRDELCAAGWPDGGAERNVLDVRILRLRRRIEPIGLVVHTVRSRGYLLDWL
jgi:DNA-binding response OmpR family regulator